MFHAHSHDSFLPTYLLLIHLPCRLFPDNDFRPQYFWFRQLHFAVLFSLNTLQTFLSGLPARAVYALPLFTGTQLVLIVYFVMLAWFRPMIHDESWKLPTKLGAIIVSSVGATLNLLSTVDSKAFTGFAVDREFVHGAFVAANVAFLGATCLLIAMMLCAFVLLLLFGGDDLLPRVFRVICAFNRWICSQLCGLCHGSDGSEIPAAGVPMQEVLDEDEEEEDEEDEDGDDFGEPVVLPPKPEAMPRRRQSSLHQLLGSLQEAAKPQPPAALRAKPLIRGVVFHHHSTSEEKKPSWDRSQRGKAMGVIAEHDAKTMIANGRQHDRMYGGWVSMRDAESRRRFYHNEHTGVSQWHPPSRGQDPGTKLER